jgi:hypothetical protein
VLYSCNEIKDFAALHKVTGESESAFARFSEKVLQRSRAASQSTARTQRSRL